jgi:tRNA dimethylallyltransferase
MAQTQPCEIISVDSVMIYQGMDIGSATPTAEELAVAPHHLIDIRDPAKSYSAAEFCQHASALIDAILARGNKPLLVGGTMMYFYALQCGLSQLPQANPTIRAALQTQIEQTGLQALYHQLENIDPQTAAQIKPQDSQRIQRAIEVYQITGETLSSLIKKTPKRPSPHTWDNMLVMPETRAQLHQRIAKRFNTMLKAGLIDEVQALYQRADLHPDLPAIRAVGYRQIWRYLAGEYDAHTMKEKAIIATRQLAKRQITWLKNPQFAKTLLNMTTG